MAAGGGGGARPPRSAFPEPCGFPGLPASPWHRPRTWCPWVGRSPNVLGQGNGRRWAMPCPGGRCRVPVGSSPAPAGGRRWAMLCPGRSRTRPPARRHSEQPRCNISNELGRLSCGCTNLGDVRAVYEVLCVCQRRECPPGSSGLQQEVLGYGVAVPPCEAQAMLVVGAVRQDRGMGLDCREMSCWARIIRPGSFLPRLREVIRICKSALCSVLWKCEPICCFP